MKKWIILLVVVAAIGGVWYYLSNYAKPFVPDIYKPKYGMVSRGDIRVPITAAGLVEPNQRIEVKSKASGEVIDRPVEAGKFVHKGDVLLVLKKDDEQRRYDGAKAELDRANALLAQAKVSVELALGRTSSVPRPRSNGSPRNARAASSSSTRSGRRMREPTANRNCSISKCSTKSISR